MNITKPKFFVGIPYPAMATKLNWQQFMISFNRIPDTRKSDFVIGDWMGDCGSFTLLLKYGKFAQSLEQFGLKIERWSECGNLLSITPQDWLCSPPVLAATGLNVPTHQRLTIQGYQDLTAFLQCRLVPTHVLPTIQGLTVEDYASHVNQYGELLRLGAWVGVGSLVGRSLDEVAAILKAVKQARPDLQIHGFGLGLEALKHENISSVLHSADSMKWCPKSRNGGKVLSEVESAKAYLKAVKPLTSDYVQNRKTATSGASNGQGRKPNWNRPTKAIRVPEEYAERLIAIAREWDNKEFLKP